MNGGQQVTFLAAWRWEVLVALHMAAAYKVEIQVTSRQIEVQLEPSRAVIVSGQDARLAQVQPLTWLLWT